MKRVILDNEPVFRLIESRRHRLWAAGRDIGQRWSEARLSVRAVNDELRALPERYRWEPAAAEAKERKRLEAVLDARQRLLAQLSEEREKLDREYRDAAQLFGSCCQFLREQGCHVELAPAPGQEAPVGANVIGGGL